MIIRDKITIRASPDVVWPWVADPNKVMQWNPKLKTIEPVSFGTIGRGTFYRVSYQMSKVAEYDVEVLEFQKPVHLKLKLRQRFPSGKNVSFNQHAIEEYMLTAVADGTELTQTITLNEAIAWYGTVLIKFILTFGKPQGKKYLEQLKELAENK